MTFPKEPHLNRVYVGDRLSDPQLRGQPCRVTATWRGRRSVHNIMVEFADGTDAVCPVRCIRKRKGRKGND